MADSDTQGAGASVADQSLTDTRYGDLEGALDELFSGSKPAAPASDDAAAPSPAEPRVTAQVPTAGLSAVPEAAGATPDSTDDKSRSQKWAEGAKPADTTAEAPKEPEAVAAPVQTKAEILEEIRRDDEIAAQRRAAEEATATELKAFIGDDKDYETLGAEIQTIERGSIMDILRRVGANEYVTEDEQAQATAYVEKRDEYEGLTKARTFGGAVYQRAEQDVWNKFDADYTAIPTKLEGLDPEKFMAAAHTEHPLIEAALLIDANAFARGKEANAGEVAELREANATLKTQLAGYKPTLDRGGAPSSQLPDDSQFDPRRSASENLDGALKELYAGVRR